VSSDLLFRYIRDGSNTVPVVALREAVAEIERLTVENEQISQSEGGRWRMAYLKLEAEIERLTAERAMWDRRDIVQVGMLCDLRAEIERLKTELAEEQSLLCTTMVERLKAEIERLRAVLAVIAYDMDGEPVSAEIARRALEGK